MTREEALEWFKDRKEMYLLDDKCQQAEDMAIKALEQEPNTGHWIYELEDWNKWTCSECGWHKRTDIHVKLGYKYCPNCGAKMESEDKG